MTSLPRIGDVTSPYPCVGEVCTTVLVTPFGRCRRRCRRVVGTDILVVVVVAVGARRSLNNIEVQGTDLLDTPHLFVRLFSVSFTRDCQHELVTE